MTLFVVRVDYRVVELCMATRQHVGSNFRLSWGGLPFFKLGSTMSASVIVVDLSFKNSIYTINRVRNFFSTRLTPFST
jgi:hypothetical protein